MIYDARQIANWFVARAARDGKALSIMSLLKLIYFAHGWHLEMFKRPLVGNSIEAWQYGPVIPEVYHAFRMQGITVTGEVATPRVTISTEVENLLEQIYEVYGRLSPFRLSELTHEEGGPWSIARQMGEWYPPIPNDLIRSNFELKRANAVEAKRA
jgi:uncharacterized phage-associated protein